MGKEKRGILRHTYLYGWLNTYLISYPEAVVTDIVQLVDLSFSQTIADL